MLVTAFFSLTVAMMESILKCYIEINEKRQLFNRFYEMNEFNMNPLNANAMMPQIDFIAQTESPN